MKDFNYSNAFSRNLGFVNELEQKKISNIKIAIPGMGTSVINFNPSAMSFPDYFDMETDMSDNELLVRFIAGMNPSPKYLRYLKYHEYIDMKNGRAPSLHLGVFSSL